MYIGFEFKVIYTSIVKGYIMSDYHPSNTPFLKGIKLKETQTFVR
jgi:hypothetical protein